MKTQLKWKKGIFSHTYLLKGYKMSGMLKTKTWSAGAIGELNGKRFSFNPYGFFKQRIDIVDMKTQELVGRVRFSSWKSKAKITVKEKEYTWSNLNFWSTKWAISDEKQMQIKSQTNSFSTKGEIASNDPDEFLILTGLFIKNYFVRRNAGAAGAA